MAENNAKTAEGRGRPFQPGQSGNPGGRPKIPREVVEAARAHTLQALRTIVRLMNAKKTPSAVRVRAAEALLDRGWGRPMQAMEHSGPGGGPVGVVPALTITVRKE